MVNALMKEYKNTVGFSDWQETFMASCITTLYLHVHVQTLYDVNAVLKMDRACVVLLSICYCMIQYNSGELALHIMYMYMYIHAGKEDVQLGVFQLMKETRQSGDYK